MFKVNVDPVDPECFGISDQLADAVAPCRGGGHHYGIVHIRGEVIYQAPDMQSVPVRFFHIGLRTERFYIAFIVSQCKPGRADDVYAGHGCDCVREGFIIRRI